jgi:hypothetical protein
MANLNLVTANQVSQLEVYTDQHSAPSGEGITAGMAVRFDTTTGLWMMANATDAANSASLFGIAVETVTAPFTVTAIRKGKMDGWDLSGLDYGDPVYLSNTDGRLADAAGTIPIIIGFVIPAFGQSRGANPDKILWVDVAAGQMAALQIDAIP